MAPARLAVAFPTVSLHFRLRMQKMTISKEKTAVTAGVDTHKDTHAVAALDNNGRLLGVSEFPATAVGHRQLQRWLEEFGQVACIGVEGTGSYGAGLTRYLRAEGLQVLEVSCPRVCARCGTGS